MDNASVYIPLVVPYHTKGIQCGIPGMDYDRQIPLLGKFQLHTKALFLYLRLRIKLKAQFLALLPFFFVLFLFHCTPFIQMKIIQTDFPYSKNFLFPAKLFQFLGGLFIPLVRVFRMNSHYRVNAEFLSGVLVNEFYRFFRTFDVIADLTDSVHSFQRKLCQDFRPIFIKTFIIIMTVCVKYPYPFHAPDFSFHSTLFDSASSLKMPLLYAVIFAPRTISR